MIDQLQKIAEERGGRCLSDTCKNAHSIVWWECENGHRWQATPIRVKLAKNWCFVCARKSFRKTIKDMQNLAADRGGRCLSETYKGARTKLLWECSEGHQWEAIPRNIKRGTWCPVCEGRFRKNIEDMQSLAAERGGRCLSEIYKGAQSKLLWECSSGHQWEAMPSGIKAGSWCPRCAGNEKHTIEEMKDVAEGRGGKCLSDSYKNNMTKLAWQCSEGHQWEAMPMKVFSGNWCPKCASKHYGDSRRLSIEEMHQIASSRGGRCLSKTYTNNRTKLLWECSEGHTWEAAPSGVRKGTWCPECFQVRNSSRSKSEQLSK